MTPALKNKYHLISSLFSKRGRQVGDFRAYFFVVVFTFSFLFFLAPQDGEAACCVANAQLGCYEWRAPQGAACPTGSFDAENADLLANQSCSAYIDGLSTNCQAGLCYTCNNGSVSSYESTSGVCAQGETFIRHNDRAAQGNFASNCQPSAPPPPAPDVATRETPSTPQNRDGGGGPTVREAPLPAIVGGTDDAKYATGNYEICDLFSLAIRFSRLLFMLAGAAALILFIWAGIQWITSAGSAEKIDSSKTILKGTVIGLIIMIAAWQMVHMLFVALIPSSGRDAETTPRQIFSSPWYDPCGK